MLCPLGIRWYRNLLSFLTRIALACETKDGRGSCFLASLEPRKTAEAELRRKQPALALASVLFPSTVPRRLGLSRSSERSKNSVPCPSLGFASKITSVFFALAITSFRRKLRAPMCVCTRARGVFAVGRRRPNCWTPKTLAAPNVWAPRSESRFKNPRFGALAARFSHA